MTATRHEAVGAALVERYAAFARAVRAEDFPAETLHGARRLVLDQLGVCQAGWDHPNVAPVHRLARSSPGVPPVTLWGEPGTASGSRAVLANRCAGDPLELLAGPECVAAAVAAAELADRSLRDLFAALAVAAEVEEHLRGWLMLSCERHGLHPPAMLGAVASATAAGWLLRLSDAALAGALAAAAALMPVSPYVAFSDGAAAKILYGGWSQMLGLQCALWAESGLRGPTSVFEGTRGVGQALLDAPGAVQPPPFSPDRRALMRVSFKAYPCNRACHAALTALERLPRFDAGAVDAIDIRTYPYAVAVTSRTQGRTPIAAQMSLPMTVALHLRLGGLDPLETYTERNVTDPAVIALARRVRVDVLPDEPADGPRVRRARVTVKLQDGRRFEDEAVAKWSLPLPATDEELVARFERFRIGRPRLDVWRLADATPVRVLFGEGRHG